MNMRIRAHTGTCTHTSAHPHPHGSANLVVLRVAATLSTAWRALTDECRLCSDSVLTLPAVPDTVRSEHHDALLRPPCARGHGRRLRHAGPRKGLLQYAGAQVLLRDDRGRVQALPQVPVDRLVPQALHY